RRVIDKLLSRSYQHRQLYKFFKAVQTAEMLVRCRKCVERSHACGFLTLLNGKVFAEAAGDSELSIRQGQHPAQEEQVSGVRSLDISSQRCRRSRQHDSKFGQARTQALFGCDSSHTLLCFHLVWIWGLPFALALRSMLPS